MIFKNKQAVSTIQGADAPKLVQAFKQLAQEGSPGGSGSSGLGGVEGNSQIWLGSSLPRGYHDVTDQVDDQGLDLLNSNSDIGGAKTLFDTSKPSSLSVAKGKEKKSDSEPPKDWVESDTDEQLMLFIPFRSTLKIHTLHITSLPRSASTGEDDEVPMRPKTIQLYTNRSHILGFEEAEDLQATQAITLGAPDWDEATGTAKIELRFVKFQSVSSLVIFVVDGEGDGEKVRIDRLRIIGESGEKMVLGKLEKIGDEPGE